MVGHHPRPSVFQKHHGSHNVKLQLIILFAILFTFLTSHASGTCNPSHEYDRNGVCAQSAMGVNAPFRNQRNSDVLLDRLRGCVEHADAKCASAVLAQMNDPKIKKGPEYLELDARALALEHKQIEALAAIRLAIETDPKQAQLRIMQGMLYQKFGDQISAIKSFLDAQRLEPRSPISFYSIGMSFFTLGYYLNDDHYYDRAERNFETALKLDPRYDKAEFMLGAVNAVEFQLAEAKQHFERALQLRPQNPYYHLYYGMLLDRLGDDSRAIREMRMAERLDPSYPNIHFHLGTLYSRLGKYPEAKKELEATVQLDPHSSAAYYALGGVLHHLGLNSLSRKAYENFSKMKAHEQEETTDPVEGAISNAKSHRPKEDGLSSSDRP